MRLKNLLLATILATGSFTFANDIRRDEVKEVKTSETTKINLESVDFCSITITVKRTLNYGTYSVVEILEATGTGETCEEATANAKKALLN